MNTSTSDGERAVATFFTQDSVGDAQLGQLGLARSRNAAVRALASALVRDHTMTARRGLQTARAMGVDDVQFKASDDNQIQLTHLARYTGAIFDREYLKVLIDAHKSDIATAEDSLEFVRNAHLRGYLQTALAVDKKHLALALAAQAQQ